MIKRLFIVLLMLSLSFNALGSKSRLKQVRIVLNNPTHNEWQLANPVTVNPGSIKSPPSLYQTIPPSGLRSISASGTGEKTNNPHFIATFNYTSTPQKRISFDVKALGATDIGIYNVTTVGSNVKVRFADCDDRCDGQEIAGICRGYQYHTCQIHIDFLDPPIRTTTVSFYGNFTPQQVSNYANEVVGNLTQDIKSCLIKDKPVSYTYTLPNQFTLSFKTQC